MNELLNTFGLLGIGFTVGIICGWQFRTMTYIREIMKMERHKNERGSVTLNNAVMIFILIIMVISVLLSAKAAHDTQELADKNDRTITCTQNILKQTVTALNQRTTYSNQRAKAQKRVRIALTKVVSASLKKNPPTQQETQKIVRNLGDALKDADILTEKARQKRDKYDYPTIKQIKNCPSLQGE